MHFLRLFAGLPPELAVIVLAMLPVGELRAAIPVGVIAYHLPLWEAFLLAQVGNAIPISFIYGMCEWWIRFAERRQGWLHKATDAVLQRTRHRVEGDVEKWGPIALLLFVGIPLPGTGAWTGALGAFLLNMPFKKALPYILLGNVLAGGIVVALTFGGTAFVTAIR